jgi:hypothetical protein
MCAFAASAANFAISDLRKSALIPEEMPVNFAPSHRTSVFAPPMRLAEYLTSTVIITVTQKNNTGKVHPENSDDGRRDNC